MDPGNGNGGRPEGAKVIPLPQPMPVHWRITTSFGPGHPFGPSRGCMATRGDWTERPELVTCRICRALPSFKRAMAEVPAGIDRLYERLPDEARRELRNYAEYLGQRYAAG